MADQDQIDGELIADIREQVLYMQELGVEAVGVDVAAVIALDPAARSTTVYSVENEAISDLKFEIPDIKVTAAPEEKRPAGSLLASLPSLAKRQTTVSETKENVDVSVVADDAVADPAAEMSVVVDEKKMVAETLEPSRPIAEATDDNLPIMPTPTETIEQIRAEIGHDCTRCKLSTLGRKQVVNSTGNFNADLMFVGEAPGADEDDQGLPFVGRAGQLLTDIIEKGLGMPRADVFIGNINRCRPPGNRAPESDETLACKPFLKREIAVIRPKVIVVLGATAAQNLLETKVPIGKLRGHFHDYLGTKVMPTFHPAYLLRDPHKKREVWEDMKLVRDLLNTAK